MVARQIHERRHTAGRVRLGLEIFIIGLAQKVLIAKTLGMPLAAVVPDDPRLAAAVDAGAGSPALSASAKLLATETAQAAIDTALQVHGARGLQRGHLLEHLYRDVRATRIYEGASEVQRDIIAREVFGRARARLEAPDSGGASGDSAHRGTASPAHDREDQR